VEAIAPEQTLASRYVLRSEIGDGPLTTVWTAEDPTLARTVAIKILHEDRGRDPRVRDAFLRQGTAGARLVHPNVLALYDAGTQDGRAFLVTEYVRGGPLGALLDERGPVSPGAAAEIMCGVLAALSCAHEAGQVHGDLSPANVLVGAEGHVKVADFGLAEAIRAAAEDGSPPDPPVSDAEPGPYRAPEQRRGEPATPASDVYAAGVLLAELLAGPACSAPQGRGKAPAPPSAIRPGIPKQLDHVVERARAQSPADRFASADAMRAALERLGGDRPRAVAPDLAAEPVPSEPNASSRRFALRSWMLVPAIVVFVGAATIVGGLAFGRLEVGGPLGIRAAAPKTPVPTSPAASAAVPIKVVAVRDVDPVSDGGDGSEDPQQTGLAIDGNPATAWSTDHYASADFGNLKPGVGLWLDLGGPATVRSITITTPVGGWNVELIGGSHPDPGGQPMRDASGRTTFTVPTGTTTVEVTPTRTDGVLLWITRLAPDGGRYSASVAEVSVSGTPG
jgi:hypothetical protein